VHFNGMCLRSLAKSTEVDVIRYSRQIWLLIR